MHRVLSITVAVLIAAFAITLSPPAMASTTASCTGVSAYKNTLGWYTSVPTIGQNTWKDNCLLGVGNQGYAVETLQIALYYCYGRKIATDGIFGPQTESALRYAQRVDHIRADGVYGPQTRDHLRWDDWSGRCARSLGHG